MALSWFTGRGKPTFKPSAHQMVEIEYQDVDGNFQAHFVEILDTPKKRLVLRMPSSYSQSVGMGPGQPITISYFDPSKDAFFSFATQVRDLRDEEFDIDLPKDQSWDSIGKRDDSFSITVALPVKYQAVRSQYAQVANTTSVTPHGMVLKTNLAIPPETSLDIVVEIPNSPYLQLSGRAKGSDKDPTDPRKHLAEVQFEDMGFEEREQLISYAVYYHKRAERGEKRNSSS